MDFAVSFPARGVIQLKSQALFEDVEHPDCRRFLECVFRAEEVSNVEIRDSVAELRFCPERHQLRDVRRPDRLGPEWPGPRHERPTAWDRRRPMVNSTRPTARSTPRTATRPAVSPQPIGKARTATDRRGVVRYFRQDTVVTGWEIKQESPGRLKLKNPVLYRKVELCQAIERELMSVLGVDKYKTSSLTCTRSLSITTPES